MLSIKTIQVSMLIALSLLSLASAHTKITNVIVGGSDKGTTCRRDLYAGSASNIYDTSPVSDLNVNPNGISTDNMRCGFLPYADNPAKAKCPVQAGSSMSLQFHNPGIQSDDPIAASHHGPVQVYLAKSDTGKGAVWFKIYSDSYDTSTKRWGVDNLISNGGKLTFTIPADISPGNYLLRSEIIALHEADRPNGAQVYVNCVELTVSGSGTANPSSLVAFPGAYSATSPGILFDIYSGGNIVYPTPGPAVYRASSNPSPTPTPAGSSTSTSTSTSTSSGRTSTSSSSSSGRTSTSTSGRTSLSSGSSSGSNPIPTGSCVTGDMKCLDSGTFSTCAHQTWGETQRCPSGLTCVQTNNVIYCR